MALDLTDETSNELFEQVRKISKKYSSGYEEILTGKLAEQILNIEKIIKNLNTKQACPLVSYMPVFDLKQQLMQPVHDYQNTEDKHLNEVEQKLIEILYALIFAYLSEYKLRNAQLNNSDEKNLVENFLEVGHWNTNNFRYAKDKITYAINHLVFIVIEDKYKKSALSSIEDKFENIEKFSSLVKNWEATFNEKEKQVKHLEEKLDKQKSTYDFVLLNKGFKQLYEQKQNELKDRRNGYSAFGVMLFFTPLCAIVLFITLYGYFGEQSLKFIIYLALPISTFMLILFYFVRVGLQHLRSVQSQMMQLELRMALCQFIHNYAEDSEKLHAKNKAGFEKFENIIFSPLVSSDDKIPTTFDGMEQLAKMVDVFKRN